MFHYYVKDSFNSADSFGTDIEQDLLSCYEKAYNLLEEAGYESGLGTGGPSYVANLYKQNDDGTEVAVEADF